MFLLMGQAEIVQLTVLFIYCENSILKLDTKIIAWSRVPPVASS